MQPLAIERLLDAVDGACLVLLGEASHGTHELYGATHLFEEPGALEKVAALATDWCAKYLKRQP